MIHARQQDMDKTVKMHIKTSIIKCTYLIKSWVCNLFSYSFQPYL